MRHLNVTFDDATYERLEKAKSGRTWREAIVQEFSIEEVHDQ